MIAEDLPFEANSLDKSPDGKYHVFKQLKDSGNSHLLLVDSDGRNPVDLSRLRKFEGSADDVSSVWD